MKQYSKTTQYKRIADDELLIIHESVTDKPSLYWEKIEKTIKTNRAKVLADIISCLDEITTKQTRNLRIEIQADEFYEPKLITKTWEIKREDYKRK